jgi:hypothetical protein
MIATCAGARMGAKAGRRQAPSVDMAPELPAALYFFSKKIEFKDSKKYERNTGTWRIICNTRMLKVM